MRGQHRSMRLVTPEDSLAAAPERYRAGISANRIAYFPSLAANLLDKQFCKAGAKATKIFVERTKLFV